MASYGIACHILIQNEQLEQVDTFPYIGFLITEDGECTMEYRTRLNRGAGDRGITAKNMEKSHFNEDTTNESASVACSNVGLYGCESWTIKRIKKWVLIDAFEMKGLRKILRISRTAKKTNEWVLNRPGARCRRNATLQYWPAVTCYPWWVTLHMRLRVLQTTTDARRQRASITSLALLHYV